MIKKWFDMTQGPKPLFKNSSMIFAVCGVAPSCVCRSKPFVISCGKKLFWIMCKLQAVYCFIKKIFGWLRHGWTWQPKVTFPLCDCSFHGSSQEILSPKTVYFVWSQSCPSKNEPYPETMCWKEFHLFHLPRLWTEVASCPHLFYAPQKF